MVLRRKAMHYCDTYGLTRQDRLDLASYLLRRDVTTWKGLDEGQLLRLLDALEGFQLIAQLMIDRHKPAEDVEHGQAP